MRCNTMLPLHVCLLALIMPAVALPHTAQGQTADSVGSAAEPELLGRRRYYYTPPEAPPSGFGVHVYAGGVLSDRVHIVGLTTALRIAASHHLAFNLGLGFYGGRDYNHADRTEIPATLDVLVFLNPRDRLRSYLLWGAGISFAQTENTRDTRQRDTNDFIYIGGNIGCGLEWRLLPTFGLTADVRAFLRRRIDSDENAEFLETDASGEFTGRTSNTSVAALLSLGAVFYF